MKKLVLITSLIFSSVAVKATPSIRVRFQIDAGVNATISQVVAQGQLAQILPQSQTNSSAADIRYYDNAAGIDYMTFQPSATNNTILKINYVSGYKSPYQGGKKPNTISFTLKINNLVNASSGCIDHKIRVTQNGLEISSWSGGSMTEANPSQIILATHAGVYRPIVPQFLGADFTSNSSTVKYHIAHTFDYEWKMVGEDGEQNAGFDASYGSTPYPEVVDKNISVVYYP